MREESEYQLMHEILNHVYGKAMHKTELASDFAGIIFGDSNEAITLIEMIDRDGNLELKEVTSKKAHVRKEYLVVGNAQGAYFFHRKGGYLKVEENEKLKLEEERLKLKLLKEFHKSSAIKNWFVIITSVLALIISIISLLSK